MLYVGIDQHRKQLTVSVRDESGNVILRRQVSTEWKKVRGFFEEIRELASPHGGYLSVVEICGFNDWLLKLLPEHGCHETVIVQPGEQSSHKTDRRDASGLSEVLWINRDRISRGLPVRGLRRIQVAGPEEQADRRLTSQRHDVGRELTRSINRLKAILRRHNLEQECPTKGIQTKRARKWLNQLSLSAVERAELNHQLARQDLLRKQLQQLQADILQRYETNRTAQLIATMPGAAAYSSLGLACRIGDIRRFKHPRSLANYWGLTPRSRNSGEANQRLGSITKQGRRAGPVSARTTGAARAAEGCLDANVVPRHQAPAGFEDCAGGRDVPAGDDPVAHGEQERTVRVRRSAVRLERPAAADRS